MMRRSARLNKNKPWKLDDESDTVMDSKDDLSIEKKEMEPSQAATANNDNAGVDINRSNIGSCSSSLALTTLSAQKNCLQNPVILHHLFQLCPFYVLASCRLVSKQWYNESLTTWRNAFSLVISMENSDSLIGPGLRTRLEDFLEFTDKPENQGRSKPYRNIKIRFASTLSNYGGFWQAIGSNITTLRLDGCTFYSADEFRQVIYLFCPVLEKLELLSCAFRISVDSEREPNNELEYNEPHYGVHNHLKSLFISVNIPQDERNILPVSWTELFSHFRSLTTFECLVASCNNFPQSELDGLVEAIRFIRKNDRTNLPFKRFQIHPPFIIKVDSESRHRFGLVRELRLPVKRIFIQMHPEMDVGFLTSTLGYIAPTLNTIKLSRDNRDKRADEAMVPTSFQDFPFEIPLVNLTKLYSYGNLIRNFRFLKYTPNLSSLTIADGQTANWRLTNLISGTNAVSNTCKEGLANLKMVRLMTFSLGFSVNDEDMQHLLNWMPNITDLKMVVSDEQFGMICQNWKNLRKLTVFGNGLLTEEGVTMMENKREAEAGTGLVIANLGSLESLCLDIQLTQKSVLHLFLHLPGLLTLFHEGGFVRRNNLDISSYQRAVEDNVVEQWIADNYGVDEDSTSESD